VKDDVQIAPRPPRKRRVLERALDKHLAIWANDPDVPEADRERVQQERDRRKHAVPAKVVGVVLAQGGATPEQLATLADALRSSHPTEVHHPFCPSRVHQVCRASGATVKVFRGEDLGRTIARGSDEVIGVVNETSRPTVNLGAWSTLRYALDRGVKVTIIWPNGETYEGKW
jgi:hypothetical protein